MLPDGIYQGWVQHQRYLPNTHRFQYPVAMLLMDLDKQPAHFAKSRFWSLERFNLISFYRRDYLQHPAQDLKTAVSKLIEESYNEPFVGQVQVLTHPRYLGVIFNPVTFYFCSSNGSLKYIVAEINNTPWNERHAYVLQVSSQTQPLTFNFDKQFHVSPFMPMAMHYQWQFELEEDAIWINMQLNQDDEPQFDATLKMQFQPFTAKNMRRLPLRFPMQTLAVVWRIYWQAFRLWLKKTPFFNHPNSQQKQTASAKGEDL